MARTFRVLVFAVIVGALGAGAYVNRDRLKEGVDRVIARESGSGTATQGAQRREGERPRRGQDQALGPTPVLVAQAASADVPVYIDGVGSVRAMNTVTVRPQVSGKLVEVAFDEGQDIRKGDVIARIDDAVYKALRDQAVAKKAQDEALLANTRNELERYTRMVQTASGTQQQVDTSRSLVAQYEAQVNSDQAAIESAQATLDYTIIRAPIDGRTGLRNVDVGNIVSSSDTTGIVTLSQIKPISVLFSIPQQRLAEINEADAAGSLSVQALSGDGQKVIDTGTLAVVDNQVDATTGTVKLKANFENEKLALWPGAFVNARLLVRTLKDVVVIPSAAVQRGPHGTFVYRLDPEQTVAMRPVTVRQQDDVQAVIADGLAPGDQVVTTGFARLQDGAKVEVSQAAGQAAPANVSPGQQKPAQPEGGQTPHRRHNGAKGPGTADAGDTTSAIRPAQQQ
jgi:multidrug efflux system membrane fusion protein